MRLLYFKMDGSGSSLLKIEGFLSLVRCGFVWATVSISDSQELRIPRLIQARFTLVEEFDNNNAWNRGLETGSRGNSQ